MNDYLMFLCGVVFGLCVKDLFFPIKMNKKCNECGEDCSDYLTNVCNNPLCETCTKRGFKRIR